MSKPVSVIFVTDGIFPHTVGGIQRHSQLLIEALAQLPGISLVVIHPHRGMRVFAHLPNVVEENPDYEMGSGNYLRELYRYSKSVSAILARYPNHVIYAQGLVVGHHFRKWRKRLVINPHGLESFQGKEWKFRLKTSPFRIIQSWHFRRAAGVIALGGKLTTIVKRAAGLNQQAVHVIPNAIPEPVAPPVIRQDIQPIKCLFVGRFAYNKGIDVLLKAVSALNDKGRTDDFSFTLAGTGNLFEPMKAQFGHLPNVDLRGFVADEALPALYREHQLFVFPTLFEGMPTVVLEAMAAGLPVLVTDVGATRELVDETNGAIIETGSVESLVAALETFAALPVDTRMQMGLRSFAKIGERFTWKAVAEAHYTLFKQVSNGIGA